MIVQSNWPPEGYHLEAGHCPNVGRPCNCIGTCQPRLVKDEESGESDKS